MKNFKQHIDKIGILGIIFSHSCCWGFPVVMSLLAGIGIGMSLIHSILVPLMIVSILISALGLFLSWLEHRNIVPFILLVISAILIFVSLAAVNEKILAVVGVIGLITASILNSLYMKKCECN